MKALILSPHPDDLEYNMGGTAILLKEKGWQLDQVIFSTCIELHGPRFLNGARLAVNHLNIHTTFLNYTNQKFMHYRSAIREEIYRLKGNGYNVVFVPCRQDWHQDHQVVTEEAIRVFRKDTTILGYIKQEIYERHHELRVDLTPAQAQERVDLLTLFGEVNVDPMNTEWFEVIQLRNYF